MTLQPGQGIRTYRVVQKIGEGGFGAVYECVQVEGDPYIAMRYMRGGSLYDALRKGSLSRRAEYGAGWRAD